MLNTVKRLLGLPIVAADGAIGSLYDIYYNDTSWNIEYFVLEIEGLLFDKRVLITPSVLTFSPDGSLHTPLSKEVVKHAHDMNGKKPSPVQPGEAADSLHDADPEQSHVTNTQSPARDKVRSIRNNLSYALSDTSKVIGTVTDFTFNPDKWNLEYVVAADGNQAMRRIHLVPVSRVSRFSYQDAMIYTSD